MGGYFRITLWKRVMVGLILGLGLGLALRYGMGTTGTGEDLVFKSAAFADQWLDPFGDAFVNLIKMLVVPLIIVTLISGVTAMGDPEKLGSLGLKTILLYMGTTAVAVTIGLVIGTVMQPGVGVDFSTASPESLDAVKDKLKAGAAAAEAPFLRKLFEVIPSNIFIAMSDGATGNVLQIIFDAKTDHHGDGAGSDWCILPDGLGYGQ